MKKIMRIIKVCITNCIEQIKLHNELVKYVYFESKLIAEK